MESSCSPATCRSCGRPGPYFCWHAACTTAGFRLLRRMSLGQSSLCDHKFGASLEQRCSNLRVTNNLRKNTLWGTWSGSPMNISRRATNRYGPTRLRGQWNHMCLIYGHRHEPTCNPTTPIGIKCKAGGKINQPRATYSVLRAFLSVKRTLALQKQYAYYTAGLHVCHTSTTKNVVVIVVFNSLCTNKFTTRDNQKAREAQTNQATPIYANNKGQKHRQTKSYSST